MSSQTAGNLAAHSSSLFAHSRFTTDDGIHAGKLNGPGRYVSKACQGQDSDILHLHIMYVRIFCTFMEISSPPCPEALHTAFSIYLSFSHLW